MEFSKANLKYQHLKLQQSDQHNQELHELQQNMKRMQSPSFDRSMKVEDQETKIIGSKQGVSHKRVKSDVPEASQLMNKNGGGFISSATSINNGKAMKMKKKASQQTSNSNLLYSDKTTPRKLMALDKNTLGKGGKNEQHNFMGGHDGSNSKKVINVSIDLIKDGELDQSAIDDTQHQLDGGQWIVVDSSAQNINFQEILQDKFKTQGKPKAKIQHQINKQGEGIKSQGISGSSNEANRQEKYKKMKQKYAKKPESNNSNQDQMFLEQQQQFKK